MRLCVCLFQSCGYTSSTNACFPLVVTEPCFFIKSPDSGFFGEVLNVPFNRVSWIGTLGCVEGNADTNTHTHTDTHSLTQAHTHICTYIHTEAHTHTHTHTHKLTHTYAHTCTQKLTHTYTHIHTEAHTPTHRSSHTHRHSFSLTHTNTHNEKVEDIKGACWHEKYGQNCVMTTK